MLTGLARSRTVLGILAAAWAWCAWPAFADEPDDGSPAFDFELRGSGFYGRLTGFVQVPLGGEPGTTSPRRPTLREIGIEDTAFYEVDARAHWRHLLVYAGWSGLEPSGSATLTEPLVSHGVTFPAGSPVHSDLRLDVGEVGVGWRFEFPEQRLTLTPKLGFALFDFSYSLRSPDAHASRAYNDGAVRLGAEAALRLGEAFSFELEGAASLPIAHMAQLADVIGRVSYHLPLPGPLRASVFLGSGIRWIEFEDSQTVPNHTHVRTGALLTGGLSLAF